MNIGIVTTLIDAEQVIDSFINYHLQIGFSHIYLFFDNPSDKTISTLEGRENITVIPCDAALRKKWLATNAYAAYGHLSAFIDTEPMARQILNMDVACQLAREDGMDWILHIDIDELFYSPQQNVETHFKDLAENGFFYKRYLNYEAIPEKEDIHDYFKEVTLFKKNPAGYTTTEASNQKKYGGHELFNYYKIGKMAARVDKIFVSGIHEFVFDKSELGKSLTLPPPDPHDPIILHFVCCGFDFFWKKYATLGNFNPKAFGRQLHGVYEKSQTITKQNNKELALTFYRNTIMLSHTTIQQLLELSLLTRITAPSKLLAEKL